MISTILDAFQLRNQLEQVMVRRLDASLHTTCARVNSSTLHSLHASCTSGVLLQLFCPSSQVIQEFGAATLRMKGMPARCRKAQLPPSVSHETLRRVSIRVCCFLLFKQGYILTKPATS